jgi:hypothetical protein
MGAATYLQQPLQHGDNSALVLQQQQQMLQQQQTQRMGMCGSDAGSAGTWAACPATSTLSSPSMDLSSLASLGSVYDASVLSGSTYSSTVNSAANSGALHNQLGAAWDKQQQAKVLDLTAQNASACSAGIRTNAPLSGVPFSEPMVSAANAAAMSGNSSDAIWQQLLQQNVMLFQTMTPPLEEEAVGQRVLLPSSAAQRQASLQAAGMVAKTSSGMSSGMPGYLPVQSQAQQLSNGSVVYTGSAMQPAQQTCQQMWWMPQGQAQQQQQLPQAAQQQQAQAGETSAVVALPLSQRQLAAMAGVLPEVPSLTGAQAWISSAATGGLQLCLSGTYTQLQAGHTAVAMLLGKAGIDEPLAAAVVHAAAS